RGPPEAGARPRPAVSGGPLATHDGDGSPAGAPGRAERQRAGALESPHVAALALPCPGGRRSPRSLTAPCARLPRVLVIPGGRAVRSRAVLFGIFVSLTAALAAAVTVMAPRPAISQESQPLPYPVKATRSDAG